MSTSRLALSLVALASIGGASCRSPLASNSQLAGNWGTAPIPSGGSITLALVTTGTNVSGSGQSRGVGPNGAVSTLTITGTRSGGVFALAITFDTGFVATYSGTISDQDRLTGSWTSPTQATSDLTLYRQ